MHTLAVASLDGYLFYLVAVWFEWTIKNSVNKNVDDKVLPICLDPRQKRGMRYGNVSYFNVSDLNVKIY